MRWSRFAIAAGVTLALSAGLSGRAIATRADESANLSISVSAPETGTPGDTIEYDIVVQNEGPAATGDAIVTDQLPDGLSFMSAEPTQGTCDDAPDGLLTCDLGALDYPGVATIVLQAMPLESGGFVNAAHVAAGLASADDMAATEVGGIVQNNIHITGPATAVSGGPIIYQITFDNTNGDADGATAQIIDTAPAGVTFTGIVSNTGTITLSCTLNAISLQCTSTSTILFGQSATVTILGQVTAAAGSTLVNDPTIQQTSCACSAISASPAATTLVVAAPTYFPATALPLGGLSGPIPYSGSAFPFGRPWGVPQP